MIDDAERLPEATVRQSLQYLLYNAPANLHVVIGSRVPLALQTAELVAKGNFSVVTIDDLRLGLEESLGILERRLGSRLTLDERACVHDVTDGWAIGLQLPIAAIEHEADAAAAVRSLSARRGTLQDYFVDSLLASLPADAVEVLARIAILEHFNRELLELLAEKPVDDLLRRLVRETPIMMVGEREGWYRLHPLARDFLLGRFEQLPASQRAALHARASHWYMQQERFHDAARHALAAGDDALAQDYAARALWVLGAWGRWTKPASGWNAFPPNCCRAMPNCAWPRPSSWRSATAMPRGCGSPRRCSPIPIPHPRWPSLPCADARHRRRNREVAPQEPVSKLSAGSREHAVDRARLLGIIK